VGADDSVNYANMIAAMAANTRAASVPSGAVDGADLSADALATVAAGLSGTYGRIDGSNLSSTRATQDESWLSRATLPLTVPTPDGDPTVVHCDVLRVPAGFGPQGHTWWMSFTPYPGATRENPCVVSSPDGTTWTVPTGGSNPITPGSEITTAGFLYGSDPDIVMSPDGTTMIVYYRLYRDDGSPKQRIYRKTSTNGTAWSAAVQCVDIPTVSDNALSPAVIYNAGTWRMWTVNRTQSTVTQRVELRTSSDGITWSAASSCTIPSGIDPWHLDVQLVNGVYYMLPTVLDQGTASRLVLLASTDGVTWVSGRTGESTIPAAERAVPLSGNPLFDVAHYRSALSPNGDGTWDVFVSARPYNERTGNGDLSNNPWLFGRIKGVTLPMSRRASRPFASTNFTRGQPTVLVPPVCMMGAAASATLWPTTNGAIFQKLPTLADYATFRYFLLKLDQTGGHMQCGVVRWTKALNWVKIADSGDMATPAAGDLAIDLGAFEMEPGSQHGLYLWFNNNNQSMVRLANIGWLGGQRMVEALTVASMQISGGANSGYSNNYVQGMALAADV